MGGEPEPESKCSHFIFRKINVETGAEGYEIYRYETEGTSRTTEKGLAVDYNSKGTLLKTLKGKKAKAYTDKKLGKGRGYKYVVRAYRTIEKRSAILRNQQLWNQR